jgi:DNA polymerase-3 subunit alpha
VNLSEPMFKVEEGAIRYALAALKGVGEGAMEKLVAERVEHGPYKDLSDFVGRLDSKTMNKRQFETLVCAGGFDGIYPNRAELYVNAEMLLRHAHAQAEERASGQVSLFGGDEGISELPPLTKQQDWDILERLRYEFDAVGFYLSAHPLDTKAGQLAKQNIVSLADVQAALARKPSSRIQMAGILIRKQERVSAKSGNKFAFLQMSDSTGVYEVMIFFRYAGARPAVSGTRHSAAAQCRC